MISKLLLKSYENYLKLELNFSENSIQAYLSDIIKLQSYLSKDEVSLTKVTRSVLEGFIQSLHEQGLSPRSQSRAISAIRNFFEYGTNQRVVEKDPSSLLEAPKLKRALPNVLEPEEIQKMIDFIDLSKSGGERDKAIVELMYSSGPRVSELTTLETQHLHFDDQLVIFTGKGNKQRLVPMGRVAINQLFIYREHIRRNQRPKTGCEKYFFLNQRGGKLSRTHIFNLIKKLATGVGIGRNVSPHTLRHSFATSLVERGADLRAVQQMLGHESITTTEIYTHLDKTYLRDVIHQFHPRS
jgi:integrase/recombinase XerD